MSNSTLADEPAPTTETNEQNFPREIELAFKFSTELKGVLHFVKGSHEITLHCGGAQIDTLRMIMLPTFSTPLSHLAPRKLNWCLRN